MNETSPNGQSAAPSVQDRKSEFVAVSETRESTSAEALLVTAYVLMWAFAFWLIARTFSRQRKLDERLQRLENHLGTHPGAAGTSGSPSA